MKKYFQNNLSLLLITNIIILFFCLLIGITCSSVLSGIKYFVYQLFIVLVPGLCLCHIAGIKMDDNIKNVLFPYTSGLIVVLLEYLLCAVVGNSIFNIVISLLVSVFSLVYLIRNNVLSDSGDRNNSYIYLVTLGITLIICYFSVTLHTVLPDVQGASSFHKDFLFWIGNSISFMKGLPVENFRLVGNTFYYHYFSSIVLAHTSMITGIGVFEVGYCYSYLIPCVLLSSSSIYLLSQFTKERMLLIVGIIMILFVDGWACFLPDHIYYCPFGFDYGYAISMMAGACLIEKYKKNDLDLRSVLFLGVLIALNTGFKGPNAIITLMAFAMVSLIMLIQKKWKKAILYGLIWLASFLVIYFICIVDLRPGAVETNPLIFTGIIGAFDNNFWAIAILNRLIGYGFADNGISRIIALILYIFENNVGALVLFTIASIYYIRYVVVNRKHDDILAILVVTALWGIVLTIATYQEGNSQSYFIMAGFPFAVSSGIYVLDRIGKGKVRTILLILVVILSARDFKSFLIDGVFGKINESIELRSKPINREGRRFYATRQEYEVGLWLKDNTDSNDYIALDCFEYDGLRKEEELGVFSERFIWNDGYYSNITERDRRRSIVDRVFVNDVKAIEELKNEKVRYLVQTLSQHPLILDLEIVYQSDDFVVYRIY